MPQQANETLNDPARVGVSIRPLRQGRFSGDQARVWCDPDSVLVCMVDGLGHGEPAEEAARRAVQCVGDHRDLDLDSLMHECDHALRGSRGAAVGLGRIDRASGALEYLSVGNTRCALVGHHILHLGGTYGVVGEGPNILPAEHHVLQHRDVLILWTDGLPETLHLVAHRIRNSTHAQELADQLIGKFAIDDDDAGVAVLRWDE